MARKTLYDNFEGKEEVFLAAFDAAVEEAMRRDRGGLRRGRGRLGGAREAGLASFLRYVAEDPALARMCMIEALSATPAATERYEDALQRFVDLTERTVPHDDGLPETIEETLVGGVAWIVYQQIRRDETKKAEDLLPELPIHAGPLRGPAEAAAKLTKDSRPLADSIAGWNACHVAAMAFPVSSSRRTSASGC